MPELVVTAPSTEDLEEHRKELAGYCYRMLGSTYDADDAVQETMVRAWQGRSGFEGRSSLRSWLYRIATNVCLDMLRGRRRRALPMDLSSPVPPSRPPGRVLADRTWIQPALDDDVIPDGVDPAERAALRDSIRLAFIAALQSLPARQRAVLILREVLAWHASEVADLLDTTVPSVNSALQRARATLASREGDTASTRSRPSGVDQLALARYVDAFERYDINTLVTLLHEDASISMPPYEMWLQGREDIEGWYLGHGLSCKGSRMISVDANGSPAFGQYRPGGSGGSLAPWSIQVLEMSGGRILHIHHFLDTSLFPRFGLPEVFDL